MIQRKYKIIRARVGGVRSISLSNPVEIPLDRSSVLAGQNSSGKSSTILGLRLLESYFNSCDEPFDSLSMPIAKTTFGEDLALNPASIFFNPDKNVDISYPKHRIEYELLVSDGESGSYVIQLMFGYSGDEESIFAGIPLQKISSFNTGAVNSIQWDDFEDMHKKDIISSKGLSLKAYELRATSDIIDKESKDFFEDGLRFSNILESRSKIGSSSEIGWYIDPEVGIPMEYHDTSPNEKELVGLWQSYTLSMGPSGLPLGDPNRNKTSFRIRTLPSVQPSPVIGQVSNLRFFDHINSLFLDFREACDDHQNRLKDILFAADQLYFSDPDVHASVNRLNPSEYDFPNIDVLHIFETVKTSLELLYNDVNGKGVYGRGVQALQFSETIMQSGNCDEWADGFLSESDQALINESRDKLNQQYVELIGGFKKALSNYRDECKTEYWNDYIDFSRGYMNSAIDLDPAEWGDEHEGAISPLAEINSDFEQIIDNFNIQYDNPDYANFAFMMSIMTFQHCELSEILAPSASRPLFKKLSALGNTWGQIRMIKAVGLFEKLIMRGVAPSSTINIFANKVGRHYNPSPWSRITGERMLSPRLIPGTFTAPKFSSKGGLRHIDLLDFLKSEALYFEDSVMSMELMPPNSPNEGEDRDAATTESKKSVLDITNAWLSYLGFGRIEIINSKELIIRKEGYLQPIGSQGHGLHQIAPVILNIFSAIQNFAFSGGVVHILEQPEVHLHPQAMTRFGDLISQLSTCGHATIILETHSHEMISSIWRERNFEIIDKIRGEGDDDLGASSSSRPTEIKFYKISSGRTEVNEVSEGPKFNLVDNYPEGFFSVRDKEDRSLLESFDGITDAVISVLEKDMKHGEGQKVEFKSTFSLPVDSKSFKPLDKDNKERRRAIMNEIAITVVAFFNSREGGRLYIGVDDDSCVRGLFEEDLRLNYANNEEQFQRKLADFLMANISPNFAFDSQTLQYEMISFEGHRVCCLHCEPSKSMHYFNDTVYTRRANRSQKLTAKEAVELSKELY